MKRTLVFAGLIPFLFGVLLLGIRLFHVGPFGVNPGDNILLARLSLTTGPTFYVVAHRTTYTTEPYEVTLYKIEQGSNASSYYLSFEDSYWWNCSIRSNGSSGEIEIRADGAISARYLPAKDLVISPACKTPIAARSVNYGDVQQILTNSKR